MTEIKKLINRFTYSPEIFSTKSEKYVSKTLVVTLLK